MKNIIASLNPWREFKIGVYSRYFLTITYQRNIYCCTTPYISMKRFIGGKTNQAVLDRYRICLFLLDGDSSV